MRHLLLVLSAALTLTSVAHATQIDDFVLRSAHHTYTFSLTTPYQASNPGSPSSVNFSEFGPGTIDGVGGYILGGYFYDAPGYPRSGLDFELPGNYTYQLVGLDLGGYTTPFLAGSFQYTDDPYNVLHGTTVLKDGPYTLTITPEGPSSVTPEPATLGLLATGALSLFSRLRHRQSA